MCKKQPGKVCKGQCESTHGNDRYVTPRQKLEPLYIQLKDSAWYRPTSLADLYNLMTSFPGKIVTLICGHTSTGRSAYLEWTGIVLILNCTTYYRKSKKTRCL